MIQCNNVSKRYNNGHYGLSNVSFHLQRGEMTFLTGHSGAGKSTLLNLIMNTEPITQGQILVNGKNLSQLSRHEMPYLRRNMGIISQNPLLIEDKTIFENVALPLKINDVSFADSARRARAALDKVGLLDKEKFYPSELSAGEQQRVSIARAIVSRPILLLADEPTGNLDPELAGEIMRLFEEFNQIGVTVLIATHDLPLIAGMHHRILILKQGQLVADTQ